MKTTDLIVRNVDKEAFNCTMKTWWRFYIIKTPAVHSRWGRFDMTCGGVTVTAHKIYGNLYFVV